MHTPGLGIGGLRAVVQRGLQHSHLAQAPGQGLRRGGVAQQQRGLKGASQQADLEGGQGAGGQKEGRGGKTSGEVHCLCCFGHRGHRPRLPLPPSTPTPPTCLWTSADLAVAYSEPSLARTAAK